jgi:hypothetical protein
MADEDSSDKKSMQRSHRTFRVWLRKWLKTSKPTEWLSSLTTLTGVLIALGSGLLAYQSGLFDVKRESLNIQTAQLRMEQKELQANKVVLDQEVRLAKRELENTKVALAEKRSEVGKQAKIIEGYKTQLASYEREREAYQALQKLSTPYTYGGQKGAYLDVSIEQKGMSERKYVNVRASRNDGKPIEEPLAIDTIDQCIESILNIRNVYSLTVDNAVLNKGNTAAMSGLRDLRELTLTNVMLKDSQLAQLSKLEKLEHLELNINSIKRWPEWPKNPNLKVLHLDRTQINDDSLELILTQFPELLKLHLKATSVTDASIGRLVLLKKLVWANLDGTALTDEGFLSIANAPKLQILSINGTKVTDEGLRRYAARTKGKDVEILVVSLDQGRATQGLTKELQAINPRLEIGVGQGGD